MKKVFLILAAMAAFCENAEACNRCGLFGNRCRFQSSHVVAPVVASVVQYKQPEVFVVQNNYPQPNGAAALLAQQGSTVYGYQQAAAQYFVSPADVLRQAAELAKAAGQTAQLGLNGYNATAQTQLNLQASFADNLSRGQAASQVLQAAGFTAPATQQQSLALRISRGADGQWAVTQADPVSVNQQITARLETSTTTTPTPAPTPEAVAKSNSIIAAKCASCHGLDKTEPKAGIFLDAGHQLDCKVVLSSLKAIKDNKMPKGGSLTPEEKGRIMEELLALSKTE